MERSPSTLKLRWIHPSAINITMGWAGGEAVHRLCLQFEFFRRWVDEHFGTGLLFAQCLDLLKSVVASKPFKNYIELTTKIKRYDSQQLPNQN